ncbi:unnamed protein product, partial [marine sediment metagenome]
MAEWYYFTDQPSPVAKWVYFTSKPDIADVVLTSDPWVLPIWSAVIEATRSGDIDPLPKEVSELGLFISTRLNILPRIIARINSEVKELFLASESHESKHEFYDGTQGYAFTIDANLKYNLLADIDSILFELNSVCELMSALFEKLYFHAGKPIGKGKVGLEVNRVIEKAGQDAGWFQNLDLHRNFFI